MQSIKLEEFPSGPCLDVEELKELNEVRFPGSQFSTRIYSYSSRIRLCDVHIATILR
jgi:hypothetical protein